MSALNLEIISAKGPVFKGLCHLVTVPLVEGDIGFMSNHEAVMARLRQGQLVVQDEKHNTITEVEVHGGYAEMSDNKLIVLLD